MIPSAIHELISQIIKMRGSLSAYYKMQSRNRPDGYRLYGDYNKHMNSISVLKGVLEISETVAEPSAGGATQSQSILNRSHKQAEKVSAEELSNRFSALEVEEPFRLEPDTNALTPSKNPGKAKSMQDCDVVYDTIDSEDEEIDFAVIC